MGSLFAIGEVDWFLLHFEHVLHEQFIHLSIRIQYWNHSFYYRAWKILQSSISRRPLNLHALHLHPRFCLRGAHHHHLHSWVYNGHELYQVWDLFCEILRNRHTPFHYTSDSLYKSRLQIQACCDRHSFLYLSNERAWGFRLTIVTGPELFSARTISTFCNLPDSFSPSNTSFMRLYNSCHGEIRIRIASISALLSFPVSDVMPSRT